MFKSSHLSLKTDLVPIVTIEVHVGTEVEKTQKNLNGLAGKSRSQKFQDCEPNLLHVYADKWREDPLLHCFLGECSKSVPRSPREFIGHCSANETNFSVSVRVGSNIFQFTCHE